MSSAPPLDVVPLPCLADNYAWLLVDAARAEAAVVDPSEAAPVAAALAARGLTLRAILVTHHHHDHIGGVAALTRPGVTVVASAYDAARARVPGVTTAVDDGDVVRVLGAAVTCLMVPGHTLGAVAFHVAAAAAVFTGDTLFTAGCGRLFEGTAAMLHASLARLAGLPEATQICCGHEYTAKNLAFAHALEPASGPIAARQAAVAALRAQGQPTAAAPLALERATNPFLRTDSAAVQAAMGTRDPVATFAALRAARDVF